MHNLLCGIDKPACHGRGNSVRSTQPFLRVENARLQPLTHVGLMLRSLAVGKIPSKLFLTPQSVVYASSLDWSLARSASIRHWTAHVVFASNMILVRDVPNL